MKDEVRIFERGNFFEGQGWMGGWMDTWMIRSYNNNNGRRVDLVKKELEKKKSRGRGGGEAKSETRSKGKKERV